MVTPHDIRAAQARIRGHVRRTPVLALEGEAVGHDCPIRLKLELLQHTGSFKPRGAFNALLSGKLPGREVVAASGGNHGAAVAYAAGRLGLPARIFVPEIASAVKVARIRSYGASVEIGGRQYADALERAEAYVARSGALRVHAYDASETVAGQGTVALEWDEESPDLDTVLVAVGGGGLIGGMAAWYAGRIRVVAVEPEGSACLYRALQAGKPVDVPVESVAADSLGAKRVGALPFAIASERLSGAVLVPDAAIERAQALLWKHMQIAAEPGGAAAFAALLSGAYRPAAGERVGVLVCGGNVDLSRLAMLTADATPPA